MKRPSTALPLLLLAAACSTSSATSSTTGDAGAAGGATGAGGATVDMRGQRYCEILIGDLQGSDLHVQVYNTQGLDDCPESEWSALDTNMLEAETMSTVVLLNGPRYWMLDSLQGSTLIDASTQSFGGIEMRQAGAIDLPTSDLAMLEKPYTQHTIQRNSDFHFFAGKTVYELVDPSATVYVMQSYSVQKKAQTEASLASLGASLTLPQGWSFQTKVLDADLNLKATNGTWTVIQDDFDNTYSRIP